MGLSLKYMPVYCFFAVAAGLLFSLLSSFFRQKINFRVTCVVTGIFSLLFLRGNPLQVYSAAVLSAFKYSRNCCHNKLTDYFSAIVEGILKNLHGWY